MAHHDDHLVNMRAGVSQIEKRLNRCCVWLDAGVMCFINYLSLTQMLFDNRSKTLEIQQRNHERLYVNVAVNAYCVDLMNHWPMLISPIPIPISIPTNSIIRQQTLQQFIQDIKLSPVTTNVLKAILMLYKIANLNGFDQLTTTPGTKLED